MWPPPSRAAAALAVALAMGGGARVARGDDGVVRGAVGDARREDARQRFARGVELFRRGDFPSALAEFLEAHRLVPRYEVLFNIGVTERHLFRYTEADRALRRYLDEGGAQLPAEKRAAAEAQRDEIARLTAPCVVRVEGAPAEISVDGAPVGQTPLDGPLLLAAGPHVVRAARAGEEPAEQTVDAVAGKAVEVSLSLRAIPPIAAIPVESAQLSVASSPVGATVFVDDVERGAAPLVLSLPPGHHVVRVRLLRYAPAGGDVELAPRDTRALHYTLLPIGPSPVAATPPSSSTGLAVGLGVGGAALLAGGAVALGLGLATGGGSSQTPPNSNPSLPHETLTYKW